MIDYIDYFYILVVIACIPPLLAVRALDTKTATILLFMVHCIMGNWTDGKLTAYEYFAYIFVAETLLAVLVYYISTNKWWRYFLYLVAAGLIHNFVCATLFYLTESDVISRIQFVAYYHWYVWVIIAMTIAQVYMLYRATDGLKRLFRTRDGARFPNQRTLHSARANRKTQK